MRYRIETDLGRHAAAQLVTYRDELAEAALEEALRRVVDWPGQPTRVIDLQTGAAPVDAFWQQARAVMQRKVEELHGVRG